LVFKLWRSADSYFRLNLFFWKICLKSALLPFYPFNSFSFYINYFDFRYSILFNYLRRVHIFIFGFPFRYFLLFFSLFNSFCSQPVLIFSSLLFLHFFIIFSPTFLLNIFYLICYHCFFSNFFFLISFHSNSPFHISYSQTLSSLFFFISV